MSAIVGALLDVSGSMKDSIGSGVDEEGGTWAHSIFRVADDLVKHDVSESNRVFVVGVGALYSNDTFDIITTIMNCRTREDEEEIPQRYINIRATASTIDDIFRNLEQNGAHTIRRWAPVNVVKESVSEYLAVIVLRKLRRDREFTRKFVNEDLPPACRSWGGHAGLYVFQSLFSVVATKFRQASKHEIEQVIANALLKPITSQSLYYVKEVSDVFHGRIKERDLTSERVRELLQLVEPFIYGSTPLHSALKEASTLFHGISDTYDSYHKLLFILSDGKPTDGGNISYLKSKFEQQDVTIVSCFISKSSRVEPRKLHSVVGSHWEDGAKFLFNLSSYIPTSSLTRAIFIKNKWKIDIENNETRLFTQVNHPDILKDVCNLARNAVCCQDALSEILVSVPLDLYINDKNRSVKVYNQGDEGTCYAHASATVLHLAMHRIRGRSGGFPEFEDLRDEMIHRHGIYGENTFDVLKEICPRYRLHCQEADVHKAMKAITEKRPVVAKFQLTKNEWDTFYAFFRRDPTGILTKRDLDISRRREREKTEGHAVVLTSFNSKGLYLMNSWGDEWGDNGFFKIENADVLRMEFIDVYWEENDLFQSERKYYLEHGVGLAATLMRSLKALQIATFSCPMCNRASNVDDFSGTLTKVCCPRCEKEFPSNDGHGNLLALNVYLTSISR